MALGNSKVRILINIDKELKQKIEVLAKKDNRSVSNFIINMLEKNINRDGDDK